MQQLTLADIKTISEISEEYGIKVVTLKYRLKNLEKGIDYKKLCRGQSTILTPIGVKKLVEGKEKIKEDHNDKI